MFECRLEEAKEKVVTVPYSHYYYFSIYKNAHALRFTFYFTLDFVGSFKSGGSGGGGRGGGRGDGGIPPWKRYTKKTLGRQAEATLESVWMRTQWPSDDTIASLWNLHRLRRDQVLTWFQDKRKKERGGGGGQKASSGISSSSSVESVGAKTDWDAEWDPLEEPDEEDEEEEV
jgi:hypothetical protein